jgi:hypothetical protein
LFKAKLTQSLFSEFSDSYQSITAPQQDQTTPFVYVDQDGVRLLTNVVDENSEDEGVFAVAVAQDGWVEMLGLYEA